MLLKICLDQTYTRNTFACLKKHLTPTKIEKFNYQP